MSKDNLVWHKYSEEAPIWEGVYWVSEGEEDSAVYEATYYHDYGFDAGACINIELWAEQEE